MTTVCWRGSHGAALLPHAPPTLCHDGTCRSSLHQFPPSYLPPCALIASRAGLDSEARAAREVHGVVGRACPRRVALGSAFDTLMFESHMPMRTRRCVMANRRRAVAGMRCIRVLTQRRPVPCGSHHEPRRTGHLSPSHMENSGEAGASRRARPRLIKISAEDMRYLSKIWHILRRYDVSADDAVRVLPVRNSRSPHPLLTYP